MVMLLSVYLSVHSNAPLSVLSVSVYLSVRRSTSLSLWGFCDFSVTLKCLSIVGEAPFILSVFNLLLRNMA